MDFKAIKDLKDLGVSLREGAQMHGYDRSVSIEELEARRLAIVKAHKKLHQEVLVFQGLTRFKARGQ